MNKKVLKTLEFDKVIEQLIELAASDKGKEYCSKLTPISNKEKIKERQAQTSDALGRLIRDDRISFGGIHDMSLYAKRLEIGGMLNAGELLKISSLLSITSRAKNYGRPKRDDLPVDSLQHFFAELEPHTQVREEIERCIISESDIADDASAGLKSVRREMNLTNEKIRKEMNSFLAGSSRDYLQDAVITMRNGRYCVPVKAEHKSHIKGMVHDQSSTGATLFIEPMSVVNLNNQLRELEIEEQKEIEKVLSALSQMVSEVMDSIKHNFYVLAELDFIFAKGRLALKMNAIEPHFNTDGIIRLKGARHPLLNPEHVVPIDIHLGDDFKQLIITGPNTGGKTVSLKTCGLLTLMGQSGLHIPAKSESELAIFHNVYADIGDEQSIEQSLSTFSSHMTNIVRILQGVDAKDDGDALVLFDELCSGTDPSEGAALAMSILQKLHALGVRTMATTHYSELKVYALSTPDVENAACEFSLETLSPTYRLLIGVPGKSNAFAISKKLGLSDDIIEDARSKMTEDDQSFEDLLVDLEQKRVQMENDRLTIESEKKEIQALRQTLDLKQQKIDEQRATIIRDASKEAADIIREAKETADETIRAFNKFKSSNPDIAEMEKRRQEVGKKLSKAQSKSFQSHKPAASSSTKAEDVHIGDRVKVLSMNMTGTVHTLPNKKGELVVSMGIIKSTVKLSDIILIADNTDTTFNGQAVGQGHKMQKKRTPGAYGRLSKNGLGGNTSGSGKFSKAASISTEIKLLGYTSDEAISILDKYLDDAYLSHLTSVRVVHGKGTGALRKAVHQYLKKQPHVKDYHLAEFGQGDAGVTIVEFK